MIPLFQIKLSNNLIVSSFDDIIKGRLLPTLLNILRASHSMTPSMSDFDSFAEYLGLNGVDADMFYEAYYDINPEEYEFFIEEEAEF